MRFKFLSLLLAFIAQCSFMCAHDIQGTYIELHYRSTPKIGTGSMKPSKAPARPNVSLSAFLDEENLQLTLSSPAEESYNYYIYDENDAVVSGGILDFSTSDSPSINLSFLPSGKYAISISRGNNAYEGVFELF